ncbi:hybrid sensor histidine kinase/response regulator [Sphingomonas ginkgonis]|nr:PAS domain-containing protein [Sphingomonas ginkgonis]
MTGDEGAGGKGVANSPGAAMEPFSASQILAVADALPMPIAVVDRNLRYRFANAMMASFFDLPRSALIGRSMREILGDEMFANRSALLAAALGGQRQWFASEFEHRSRGLLAVQSEYIPQTGSSGEVESIVVIIQDVTEQRVAERALKESEARFRRIADFAPVLMWVTRLDRSRDFVNQAYLDFAGLRPDEVHRHDWKAWIHPDDFARIAQESLAGEASRQPFTLEGRFRRADGAWRWLRSVSSPRYGPDGELVGFIGAGFDITVAKEAELELRRQVAAQTAELGENEARLRGIFDSVREIIALLKPDGTVVQLNRTQSDWRDPRPEQAVGQKIWDSPTMTLFPEHHELLVDAVAVAARGGEFSRQIEMARDGQATAHLDISLRPVAGEDGAVTYILFEARDITELKAAQEQLRQSQKMEALGQLTGGIAHDFNNLLTVVVGGLDLIKKRVEDPRLLRYASNALEAAERGARLTAQLLAFSRVQRLEVKPVKVAPLIENMRPLLRNVLGPGIVKNFDLDGDPVTVMADPTQLELAVLNLAINARDAMPEGGRLLFRSVQLTVRGDSELEDGDYVELSIADSGTGMSEEVKARAFDPFFTTKEVGKGTGLGLSMVYGVARQSGGTARIESVAGEGTTVRLYFRRSEEDEAISADGPRLEARDGNQARVLVVDDDADVRHFIAVTLDDLGYAVREAGDGPAALDAFEQEAPDLVVLDFAMPGMNGAEVAKALLGRRPGQPILFVSGYSDTEEIRRVAPAAPLLAKPFRSQALDAAVRGALDGTVAA